ncbi:hypothetical protein E3N88_32678 [Mikania micrantha]|uniref:Reverse transcriptase domain-containing protein n=1 Tax=Mikania micrantha TaxID=192012 RepID=A0A5N6MBR1_9ASTR|nr:hypothetical protein E3N88_32678 [Mikania micrantha]
MADQGGRLHRNPRRHADRGNEEPARDPRDVEEIARLQQRIRDLELQRHGHFDDSETESVIWEEEFERHNPFGRPNPRRVGKEPDYLRSMGVKIDIPEFDGRSQPDEFIDWLQTVERIFDLREIPDKYKVKLVAIKLQDPVDDPIDDPAATIADMEVT